MRSSKAFSEKPKRSQKYKVTREYRNGHWHLHILHWNIVTLWRVGENSGINVHLLVAEETEIYPRKKCKYWNHPKLRSTIKKGHIVGWLKELFIIHTTVPFSIYLYHLIMRNGKSISRFLVPLLRPDRLRFKTYFVFCSKWSNGPAIEFHHHIRYFSN